jgi:hypothetical protein
MSSRTTGSTGSASMVATIEKINVFGFVLPKS